MGEPVVRVDDVSKRFGGLLAVDRVSLNVQSGCITALIGRGITILMIEHVMQAVMSLAQHVYVLAEGRILTEGSPQAVVSDARVIEAYLGRGAAARLSAAGGAPV